VLVNPPIHTAAPTDYDAVAPRVDAWWGRPILGSLPRLFFDLPLYEEFFRLARAAGRTRVSAITATVTARSADFHRAMGFAVTGLIAGYNGPVTTCSSSSAPCRRAHAA
jgi:hypothetical protein